MQYRVRRPAAAGAVLLAGLLAAGCAGAKAPAAAPAPATAPAPAATVENAGAQQAPAGTAGTAAETPWTRTSEGGNVTVGVTWLNPRAPDEGPRFAVELNTHSENLDEYRLEVLSVLRAGDREIRPESWSASGSGHHRQGVLQFPARVDGRPVIAPGEGSVELVIRNVAGVPERVFTWEVGR